MTLVFFKGWQLEWGMGRALAAWGVGRVLAAAWRGATSRAESGTHCWLNCFPSAALVTRTGAHRRICYVAQCPYILLRAWLVRVFYSSPT